MYLNWRERLDSMPELRRIEEWPNIDPDMLVKNKRKRFLRNRKIVARVIAGEPIKDVAALFGVHNGTISRLMTRCLAGDEINQPALTTALVPNQRLRPHQRRAPLDSIHKASGHQNSFRALLRDVPNLKRNIDKMITDWLKRKESAQVVSPMTIFGEFKRSLRAENWPTTIYPYTTQNMGYEALRRYLHEKLREYNTCNDRKRNRIAPLLKPIYRPFRSIQIDAQVVDLNSTVHIQFNEEIVPTRISRAALIIMRDLASQGILAYHLALTDEPNQNDVLQVFDNFKRKWMPIALETPSLSYVPGSGFPSMWGDPFTHLCVQEVKLDNALVHLANSVRRAICHDLGGTLNLGLPASPLTRNFVEAAFNQWNKTAHRFPSTTGSHPKDPIRETRQNAKRAPLLTLRTLEEILSVQIAAHNVKPRAELSAESPLDYIRRTSNEHYIRWLPKRFDSDWNPFLTEKVCSVIWPKNERRRPHINFAHVRHHGDCLSNLPTKHNKILIRFDRREVRTVKAYTLNGDFIGILYAPRSWQRFAHSLHTRNKIFSTIKSWSRHQEDPLAEYFHLLAKDTKNPSSALELVRIYREANMFLPSIGQLEPKTQKSSKARRSKKIGSKEVKKERRSSKMPSFDKWHTSLARCNQPQP